MEASANVRRGELENLRRAWRVNKEATVFPNIREHDQEIRKGKKKAVKTQP